MASSYNRQPYVLIKLSFKLQWYGMRFDLYWLNMSGWKGLIRSVRNEKC